MSCPNPLVETHRAAHKFIKMTGSAGVANPKRPSQQAPPGYVARKESQPVSIVALGKEMKVAKYMKTWKHNREREGFTILDYDLTQDLKKDPSLGGIGHCQDGSYPNTVKCVMSQEGFVAKMLQIVADAVRCWEQRIIFLIILWCNGGFHRADVVARTAKSILNVLPDNKDPVGDYFTKKFNAQLFSLCAAYGKDGESNMLDSAKFWMKDKAWHQIPNEYYTHPWGDGGREKCYGFEDAMCLRQSGQNFNKLWNEIEKKYGGPPVLEFQHRLLFEVPSGATSSRVPAPQTPDATVVPASPVSVHSPTHSPPRVRTASVAHDPRAAKIRKVARDHTDMKEAEDWADEITKDVKKAKAAEKVVAEQTDAEKAEAEIAAAAQKDAAVKDVADKAAAADAQKAAAAAWQREKDMAEAQVQLQLQEELATAEADAAEAQVQLMKLED